MTAAPDSDREYAQRITEAALNYAARGWHVFPVSVFQNADGSKALGPEKDWRNASTTDPDRIREWFSGARPGRVLAIDTGKSGLAVIDLDVDPATGKDGYSSWRDLGVESTGYTVLTPTQGLHLYYEQHPENPVSIDSSGKLGHGVDVRGDGGFVIAAPSQDFRGAYVTATANELVMLPEAVRTQAAPARSNVVSLHPNLSTPTSTSDSSSGLARFHAVSTPHWSHADASKRITTLLDECANTKHGDGFNHALNRVAMEIGHWVDYPERQRDYGPGFLTEGDAWALLSATVSRQFPLGTDANDEATMKSGLSSGMGEPWVLLSDAAASLADSGKSPASVDEMAAEGWEPEAGTDLAEAVAAMEEKFLDDEGLRNIPPPVPLVNDLLFRDTIARINGRSGGGKSFLALDLAAHVANGTPWHGHGAVRGRVLYIVAEGATGQRQRVDAWCRHTGMESSRITFLPEPVQISGAEWRVLEAVCAKNRFDLVVLDTQARITVGVEENSATEMGEVVDRLETLRRAAGGACVLLVHHTGKDSERGARGSSAMVGAMTTEFEITRKDGSDEMTVYTRKQKDAPELEPFGMRMVSIGDSLALETMNRVPVGEDTDAGLSPLPTIDEAEELSRCSMGPMRPDNWHPLALWMIRFASDFGKTRSVIAAGATEINGAPLSRTTVHRAIDGLRKSGVLDEDGQSLRWVRIGSL